MTLELRMHSGKAFPELAQPHWKWVEDPLFSHALHEDDTPVAILRIFERRVYFPCIEIKALGIGGVFVPEHLRGRGYGSALVRESIEALRRAKTKPLLLLFSRDRTLYANFGFQPIHRTGREFLWALSLTPEIEVSEGYTETPWMLDNQAHF